MRVGVICEGMGDFAVIRTLVKSLLGIDYSDIKGLRPKYDATEISLRKQSGEMQPNERSNWTLVRKECIEKEEIDKFVNGIVVVDDPRKILIIHLDTDRCEDVGYDLRRPAKSDDLKVYSQSLRNAVIEKINEWLGEIDFIEYLVYAIAIEETEAWLIPLYNNSLRRDTCSYDNAKRKFENMPDKPDTGSLTEYQRMQVFSDPLTKKKIFKYCIKHNESLKLFIEDLQTKVSALQ